MSEGYFTTSTITASSITFAPNCNKEVIRIDSEGRLFWNGREVTTDDDFRSAMLDLARYFQGR